MRIDQTETTVERFCGWTVFFENIRVGPIRKNIGKAFAAFDCAEDIRRIEITVMNGVGV